MRAVALAGVLALGAVAAALVAGDRAEAQGAPTPRQEYDAAQGRARAAQARVDELFAARRTLELEGSLLTVEQQAIAERLEAARQEANQFVVAAYISGSTADVEEAIVQQESTTDVAYKTFFVKDRAERVKAAVDQQRAAFTEVDQRLAEFAVRRSDNATALDEANAELERALGAVREADGKLRAAEAAAKPPPSPLTGGGGSGGGGGGGSGNASSSGWAKLRQCESGGRYNAVSSNGLYRGAYQFDTRTWQSVGGSGDPAAASPAEQDYRAQILFNQRGAQPWPVCGKNLANDPNARRTAVAP